MLTCTAACPPSPIVTQDIGGQGGTSSHAVCSENNNYHYSKQVDNCILRNPTEPMKKSRLAPDVQEKVK